MGEARYIRGFAGVIAVLLTITCLPSSAQNLVIADGGGNDAGIQEWTSAGKFVQQLASQTSGGLNHPNGIQFGPDGHLYVTSRDDTVKKYDGATGAFLGNAYVAEANALPIDLAFDHSGNLYVLEFGNHLVRKVDLTTGAVLKTYDAGLSSPEGICVSANDTLLVSDGGLHEVLEVDPETGSTTVFATGFTYNIGIALGPDGRYYIADYGAGVIRVVGPAGGTAATWSKNHFSLQAGYIAFSGGNLFVTVTNSGVERFNGATGIYVSSFFRIHNPWGIAARLPAVQSIKVSPSSVVGGKSAIGTVKLAAPAPIDVTIVLGSNLSAAHTPASIVIARGSTSGTFTVTTDPVPAVAAALVTANFGGMTHSATLTINPPSLSGLRLSPSSIKGGGVVTGKVTLNGVAAVDTSVQLTNTNPLATLSASSVTVAAGSTSGSFSIQTLATTSVATGIVSSTLGTITKTAMLTVRP